MAFVVSYIFFLGVSFHFSLEAEVTESRWRAFEGSVRMFGRLSLRKRVLLCHYEIFHLIFCAVGDCFQTEPNLCDSSCAGENPVCCLYWIWCMLTDKYFNNEIIFSCNTSTYLYYTICLSETLLFFDSYDSPTGFPTPDLSYQRGVRYTYRYSTTITTTLHGSNAGRNGLALDCVVDIDVVSKCHLMMQVSFNKSVCEKKAKRM